MRIAFLIVFSCVIAGCSSTQHTAPIVDRSPRPESRPIPATTAPAGQRQMDSHGFYTVKKGDTLHQIALDFGQNYRDLVAWNNLANANDIRVDQILRVVPPATAQPSVVSTNPGIEVRPLGQPVAGAAQPAAGQQIKTGPRGEKLPYSEATLAEMQKPDMTALAPANGKPESKPVDKSTEPAANGSAEDAAISWIWPADGKLIGTYDDGRKGIDIGGKPGQQVVAAATGKVMYAGSGIRGYGNLVIVKHTNNLLSAYAHNKTILVKEGQSVAKGEKIAEMGNSDADAVKLHFEIRQQGKPVDPSKFLPNR